MKQLSKSDLLEFQLAIEKDYGVKLEGKELYEAAYNLLGFFEELAKDQKAKKVLKTSEQPH